MPLYSRYVQAAICLPILGLLFFLPPYISILDQDLWIVGLPALPLLIFTIWFIGIVLTFWVSRKLTALEPKLLSNENHQLTVTENDE